MECFVYVYLYVPSGLRSDIKVIIAFCHGFCTWHLMGYTYFATSGWDFPRSIVEEDFLYPFVFFIHSYQNIQVYSSDMRISLFTTMLF